MLKRSTKPFYSTSSVLPVNLVQLNLAATRLDDLPDALRTYLSKVFEQRIIDNKLLLGQGTSFQLGSYTFQFINNYLIRPKSNAKKIEGYAIEIFDHPNPEKISKPVRVRVLATLNFINSQLVNTRNKPRVIELIPHSVPGYPFTIQGQQFLVRLSSNEWRMTREDLSQKKPYDVKHHHFFAFVKPYNAGVNFREFCIKQFSEADSPLKHDLSYILKIYLQLLNAYRPCHEKNIILANMDFASFIIQPETLTMKLINYQISRYIGEDGPQYDGPKTDPEIKRKNVSHSLLSDLYSLGIIFKMIWNEAEPHLWKKDIDLSWLDAIFMFIEFDLCTYHSSDRTKFEEAEAFFKAMLESVLSPSKTLVLRN